MPRRSTPWPAGAPCWVDLTVPDVAGALAFYSAVLGWTFVEDTSGAFGGYATARVDGAAAAGIGPVQVSGMRPAWTLYLASDDVDATARAVAEHGGTVLVPPGDVGPLGRLALAAAPGGAPFGIWQAGEHIGVEVYSEPGGLAWEDLRSNDPATDIRFYRSIFGYETRPVEMAGPDYRTFHLPGDDAPLGGMGPFFGPSAGVAPHWLVYFGVADVDAALSAATAAGGSVPAPAFDSPFGRMATVVDPFGASFTVAQTDAAGALDRGERPTG